MYEEQLQQLITNIFTWENILQFSVIFLLYLGSDKQIVNTVNWLKERLEWSGKKAEVLVITLAVLVSTAVLFVEGIITPESFNPANFAVLITTITYAAQKRYARLKQKDLEAEVF